MTKSLTNNFFSPKETQCKCGCGFDILPEMRDKLNEIRTRYGAPIGITSGARCEAHNVKIGGSKKSAHVEGKATDLKRTDDLLKYILTNLEKHDIYIEDPNVTTSWIHIQIRPTKNRIFKP